MKILLTTPREPYYTPFFTDEKRIPVGLAFLVEQLREAGHQVYIIDNYLLPTRFWETGFLRYTDIDLVGIHANTICLAGVIEIATHLQFLRERGLWRGKIALGGPLTSTHKEQIPEWVDHVVIGEGENAILEIAEGTSERIIERTMVENLDDLPLPRFEDFLHLPYDFTTQFVPGKRVITLNTSRGCPFQCAFCSVRSVWGRKYRYMSAERVLEWVEMVHKRGFEGIYFREDHFTLNPERTVRFCELLLQKNLKIDWACESRVDSLTEEMISLMAQSGCRAVYIGVESGSDAVLEKVQKKETTEQFRRTFRWFKAHGIRTYASFVVGMPGTTEEDDALTRRFAKEIEADFAGFNNYVGIPYSPMYHIAIKENRVRFRDYRGLLFLRGHNERVRRNYGVYELRRRGLHPLMALDSFLRDRVSWSVAPVTFVHYLKQLGKAMEIGIPFVTTSFSRMTMERDE